MFFQLTFCFVVVFAVLAINARWINKLIIHITSTRVESAFYGLPRSIGLKSRLKSEFWDLFCLNVELERNFIFLTPQLEWIAIQHDQNEMDLGQKLFTHDAYDSSLELLDGVCLSIFKSCSTNGIIWTKPPVLKSPRTCSFINISRFLRMRQRDIFFINIQIEKWCFRISYSSSTRLVELESRNFCMTTLLVVPESQKYCRHRNLDSYAGNSERCFKFKIPRTRRPGRPSPLFINSPTLHTNLNLCFV